MVDVRRVEHDPARQAYELPLIPHQLSGDPGRWEPAARTRGVSSAVMDSLSSSAKRSTSARCKSVLTCAPRSALGRSADTQVDTQAVGRGRTHRTPLDEI